MPKKKDFAELPYDPIAADLMREVAQGGRGNAAAAISSKNEQTPPQLLSSSRPEQMLSPRRSEPTITKRFLLTRSENEELESFLRRLQRGAGTKVTLSMFTRAVVNVVMQAEAELLAEVGDGIPRRFPSTHDSIAQGAFEEWWMRCLANALRRLPRNGAVWKTMTG